ncbi:unnamed protein product [Mytilus coruscus]|uniref:Reverse transcriptase domain-containing protein n=1 Tax=Mytilus coruscus TaxID=42192 RepID=A0A6J8ESR5_MYTCO|nr:unnamed protein product [Mytilus coruscus]
MKNQLQTNFKPLQMKAIKLAVPAKPIKLQGPKWKATPTVRKHLKSYKLLYSHWKNQGRPQNHPSHTELRTAKKLLRNSQRIEQAIARKQLYQQIMEKPTRKLFYRLINRNRKSRNNTTNCLEIDDVKSYRGITVTPIIGKVHELCILQKLQLQPGPDLQFGFTEGLCPLMASLLVTEAKCEKLQKNIHVPLFITTVDVQSAFDVVKHIILMDKLLDEHIPPDLLQLIKELYTDLESKVKWMGDTFNIKQGVRQGGILSTHLYKLYVQDILEELKNNSIGFLLGNIYIGAPTCADDIALLSSDTSEMQLMLAIIGRYADQHQLTSIQQKLKSYSVIRKKKTTNGY